MANNSEVSFVANTLWSVNTVRYSELCSSTIMLFDHLITIDKEVELIWQASWSPGKILFIINRYHGLAILIFNNYALFVPNITDSFCLSWFQWQGCIGLIVCMTAEVILQLRLFALYLLSKKVLLIISVAFLLSSAAAATLMGTVLANIEVSSYHINGNSFCAAKDTTGHFYAFWIPILVYETFLCSLALLRGLQNFRSSSPLYLSGKRVFEILVRDSILYFLIMFATYLVNLVLFYTEPNSLIEVPIGFAVAMSCVMGNRLLLNIRDTARRTDLSDMNLPFNNALSRQTAFEMVDLRTSQVEEDATV